MQTLRVDRERAHELPRYEGLGVLTLAIEDYRGGTLIISHHEEFGDESGS